MNQLKRDWLLVSEMFSTLQGEGPSAGQPAFFVRLGGCNQHCHWCDTPYAVFFDARNAARHDSHKQYDPSVELKRISIIGIAESILKDASRLCVITGGEPLLQAEPLAELISRVNESVYAPQFEIETAGTIDPTLLFDFENVTFNVSPKLASSGNEKTLRYQPEILQKFAKSNLTRFKFVITTGSDYRTMREDVVEVKQIISELEIYADDVWLMPEGTTAEQVLAGLKMLAPVAIENKWNLTNRLHVMLWGNERGR
jgi:7-carboxy-7-deazaguanine synthase